MEPNEQTGVGAADGPADASSGGTSDFAAGFDSADEFLTDLPQDAGSEAEGLAAGAPGEEGLEGEQEQHEQVVQDQGPPQQPAPAADAQPQGQPLYLDSTGPIGQMLQTLVQNEQQIVQAVAEQLFKLSDADKEALETDAVAAMPQLGAKVYVKALQASANLVQKMVPQMLQMEINKHQALMTVEQAFFQQFPQLDRWTHGQDILAVGQALRAQNPNLPPQDLLRRVASAVMGMHGIQAAAPRRQGNGQRPFSPAPSGASMGQPNLAQESPFAGLGFDYED